MELTALEEDEAAMLSSDSSDLSDAASGEDEAAQDEDEPARKRARASAAAALRKPPTADELISLRQTQNLFHSNLFQLQTTEMLTEVTPTEKQSSSLSSWLSELESFLLALPARPARPLNKQAWLQKSGLRLPLPPSLPDVPDAGGSFGFGPPARVVRAGALAAGTLERGGTADLLLEMPHSCVEKGDLLNARYARKRALYLTYLAWRLRSSGLVSSVEFSFVDGDRLRAALLLRPAGRGARRHLVRLLPVPPAALFPLGRLSPAASAIQSKWRLGAAVPPQEEEPTPSYNSAVMADVKAAELAEWMEGMMAELPAARQAVRMLAVWLRQRGLDRGPGAVDVQVVVVFVLWLLSRRRLSKLMSSYQVMRNVWVQLTKTDWATEGVTFVDNPSGDQPALHQFNERFDVVLLEPSGHLNVAWAVTGATYARLKDEAARAVAYLDDPEVDSFQALFMTPVPFLETMDQVWRVRTAALTAPEPPCRDRPAGGLLGTLPRLLTVLRRGLTDRAVLVDLDRSSDAAWPPAEAPPTEPHAVTIGLRLNPARLTSIVDKGPGSENRLEAQEFRSFWGRIAGTRRFQDGGIQEAVVWKAETLHEHRMVCRQIVTHLLHHHFKVTADDVRYLSDGPELLLTQTRALPAFPHGSGEEAELALAAAFARLAGLLRRLHALPLGVAAVHAAGPALRHAEVFPPLPEMYHALSGRSVRQGSSQILERQSELPLPYAPVSDVIIQLEVSGKWPEEPEAIRRVKAALHLQIREELSGHGLTAATRRDGVLTLCDGYLFRLAVAYPREPALLRLKKQPAAAAALERETSQLPRLTSALAGLQRHHPAYSASVRLALRWLAAQMMSGLVPDIAAELLMAQVFLSPAPLAPPEQPAPALLRWLRLLARSDWRQTPLCVSLNQELPAEKRAPLLAKFGAERDSFPPWTVFTPYDETGAAWTRERPTAAVLHHLQKLAASAHDLLTAQLSCAPGAAPPDWRAAFRPPLDSFDVRVRLRRRQLPRRHQAVDPRGPPARADRYERHPYEALPAPALDPVEKMVAALRAATSSWTLVCHDACGGDLIGVVVRKEALRRRPFAAFRAEGEVPAGEGMVVASVEGLVDLVWTLGDGLVEDVEVEADRLAAYASA